MNRCGATWRQLLAALIVVVGLTTVWATLVFWGATTYELARMRGRVQESVQLTLDGTPVITTRSGTQYLYVNYRTLDGKSLEDVDENWLVPAHLMRPPTTRRLFRTPIRWTERVASLSDGQRPPTSWYLIRNAEPDGRAYLAGFDALSGLPVGYLGRDGFRPARPPIDEHFDLGKKTLSWGSGVASVGYVAFGAPAQQSGATGEELRIPAWHMFVADGQEVVEVDLRSRSTRTVFRNPEPSQEITGIYILTEPEGIRAAGANGALRVNPAAFHAQDGVFFAPAVGAANKQKTRHRLVVRSGNRLTLIDPPTGEEQQYELPERFANRQYVAVYSLGQAGLVLQSQDVDREAGRHGVELAWVDTESNVTRRERVELAGFKETDPRLASLVLTAAIPALLPIVAIGGLIGPLGMLQNNQAASYQDALWKILNMGWPALVAALVLSAVVTWLMQRHHRRHYFPHRAAWTWFVFLLGVPGWVVYRLGHRQPPLVACASCAEVVPRDRPTCPACASPFPAPALLGTEVFG